MPEWSGPAEAAALAEFNKTTERLRGMIDIVSDASPNATGDQLFLDKARDVLRTFDFFINAALAPNNFKVTKYHPGRRVTSFLLASTVQVGINTAVIDWKWIHAPRGGRDSKHFNTFETPWGELVEVVADNDSERMRGITDVKIYRGYGFSERADAEYIYAMHQHRWMISNPQTGEPVSC